MTAAGIHQRTLTDNKASSTAGLRMYGQAWLPLRIRLNRRLHQPRRDMQAVKPFHPVYSSRICNTWMALASSPARQGEQRSLRRMRQVFSWAFARSPGERSFAWARLASFCDSGLFLPGTGSSRARRPGSPCQPG